MIAAECLNIMMNAWVKKNLFDGYYIGMRRHTPITHLQFADDTLLVGEKSWANIRALKAVLILFEAVSWLKVNFHKVCW